MFLLLQTLPCKFLPAWIPKLQCLFYSISESDGSLGSFSAVPWTLPPRASISCLFPFSQLSVTHCHLPLSESHCSFYIHREDASWLKWEGKVGHIVSVRRKNTQFKSTAAKPWLAFLPPSLPPSFPFLPVCLSDFFPALFPSWVLACLPARLPCFSSRQKQISEWGYNMTKFQLQRVKIFYRLKGKDLGFACTIWSWLTLGRSLWALISSSVSMGTESSAAYHRIISRIKCGQGYKFCF